MAEQLAEHRNLVSASKPIQLGASWQRRLTTRSGFEFRVRPVAADDEAALADFFAHVTPEELRFRFLTACREVGHARLVAMTDIDHDQTENFLAVLDDGTIIASGLIATDADRARAEVAISIRSDHRGQGISWTLLDHIAQYAEARGIKVIESIEARENRAAIGLEKEMGFIVAPVAGDPTLIRLSRYI
ncbi:GNAT family N-acetyltransferase [Polymorphobacter fuscus]|uniref:GNAT family N-acetyltransferase n=1 Tax=Sandarakinorhabdus fusca TaxID=1439888 RepID=A0A7C9KPS2_9SPHN|nr:GNAT family N-acetyltransferase [Polymorphobacter fuscus]KAB7643639.1 GNAT family N-acetyltransferase [Polymorphobacter fuscus]MQT18724.1 GNAT family N-acetyltransferase [Polymorphobacter fuscus]NJC09614.1 GNAT superfamily N-acetyltransferase [Polymorphobacter fuscus]